MSLTEKLHLFSCVFMTGVIWIVQVVQYPGFAILGESEFKKFHQKHSDLISYIVAPVMMLELVCAYLMVYYKPDVLNVYYFVSTILIFIVTAFVSVPIHNKLALGLNLNLVRRLVLTNWPRTILWSLKLVVLFFYL
jgi:hypothetical protein